MAKVLLIGFFSWLTVICAACAPASKVDINYAISRPIANPGHKTVLLRCNASLVELDVTRALRLRLEEKGYTVVESADPTYTSVVVSLVNHTHSAYKGNQNSEGRAAVNSVRLDMDLNPSSSSAQYLVKRGSEVIADSVGTLVGGKNRFDVRVVYQLEIAEKVAGRLEGDKKQKLELSLMFRGDAVDLNEANSLVAADAATRIAAYF